LGYMEPALNNKVFSNTQSQTYAKGLCPVAESIQPRLILLKTNFENLQTAKEQAEILTKTVLALS
jgi:perosamine synthetase